MADNKKKPGKKDAGASAPRIRKKAGAAPEPVATGAAPDPMMPDVWAPAQPEGAPGQEPVEAGHP